MESTPEENPSFTSDLTQKVAKGWEEFDLMEKEAKKARTVPLRVKDLTIATAAADIDPSASSIISKKNTQTTEAGTPAAESPAVKASAPEIMPEAFERVMQELAALRTEIGELRTAQTRTERADETASSPTRAQTVDEVFATKLDIARAEAREAKQAQTTVPEEAQSFGTLTSGDTFEPDTSTAAQAAPQPQAQETVTVAPAEPTLASGVTFEPAPAPEAEGAAPVVEEPAPTPTAPVTDAPPAAAAEAAEEKPVPPEAKKYVRPGKEYKNFWGDLPQSIIRSEYKETVAQGAETMLKPGQSFTSKYGQKFEIVDVTENQQKVWYRDLDAEAQNMPPTPLNVKDFINYIRQGVFKLEEQAAQAAPTAEPKEPEPVPVSTEPAPEPIPAVEPAVPASVEATLATEPPPKDTPREIMSRVEEDIRQTGEAMRAMNEIGSVPRNKRTGFKRSGLKSWFGARANVPETAPVAVPTSAVLQQETPIPAAPAIKIDHIEERLAGPLERTKERQKAWEARKQRFPQFMQRFGLVARQAQFALSLIATITNVSPDIRPPTGSPAPIVAEAPIPPASPQQEAPRVEPEVVPHVFTFPENMTLNPGQNVWANSVTLAKNITGEAAGQFYIGDHIHDRIVAHYPDIDFKSVQPGDLNISFMSTPGEQQLLAQALEKYSGFSNTEKANLIRLGLKR